MNIAILGSTSQIAKNLIRFFRIDEQYKLFLFARNCQAVHKFLASTTGALEPQLLGFDEFLKGDYDVVINCVGIADPRKQKEAGVDIFLITEHFDNLVLNYLFIHKDTIYINFSSGAVYGTTFTSGVNEKSAATVAVNNIKSKDYYRIAKLNSEAKHRAVKDRKIIDLRVFSFFSRFIDLSSSFLVAEMVRSAKCGNIFETTREDIVRDYVAPEDLWRLVLSCTKIQHVNSAFDVYSRKPVSKLELIAALTKNYALKVHYQESDTSASPTGQKNQYFSKNHRTEIELGYLPHFSSLDSINIEVAAIMEL
ncbi:MAG: NAD-dependent epimerase/dehydratase family protein [Nitrospirota bacterium]|nr:NAD-dependent epimerase/dehydratase family protein [Nitrospirota bacterium]